MPCRADTQLERYLWPVHLLAGTMLPVSINWRLVQDLKIIVTSPRLCYASLLLPGPTFFHLWLLHSGHYIVSHP
jgi:hypothetical protein